MSGTAFHKTQIYVVLYFKQKASAINCDVSNRPFVPTLEIGRNRENYQMEVLRYYIVLFVPFCSFGVLIKPKTGALTPPAMTAPPKFSFKKREFSQHGKDKRLAPRLLLVHYSIAAMRRAVKLPVTEPFSRKIKRDKRCIKCAHEHVRGAHSPKVYSQNVPYRDHYHRYRTPARVTTSEDSEAQ